MPLLDSLAFIDRHLTVTYRADAQPQLLRILARTAGPSGKRTGPIVIRKLMDLISHGAAAGRLFQPEESSVERVSGPWDGPDAFGPSYAWVLRVSAVCPEFMRTAVELVRKVGWEQPLEALDIYGSLPPDGSKWCATTSTVRRALDSAEAYVPRCRAPSFDIDERVGDQPLFELRLHRSASPELVKAIEVVFAKWLAGTASIIGADGTAVDRSLEQLERMLPKFIVEERTLACQLDSFAHARRPSTDMLVNMLQRLNARERAIARLAISLPHT